MRSDRYTRKKLQNIEGYTDTEVAAILVDTATTLPGLIAALENLSAADVNTQVDTALNTIVPASPTAGSLNDVLSKAAGGNTFDKSTDSLEAIRDRMDTLNTADQADLDAILLDTGTTLPATLGTPAGADMSTDIAAVKSDTAAILTDTGTTLPATLGTPAGADLATDIAAVKADTAAVLVDTGTTLPATFAAMEQCVEKSDGAVLTGADDLFTITGGPVVAKIVGIVTTVIGGASSGKLQITTTEPAATVDLNAGAVAIDSDAAGTSYRNVGATSVFTPVTAGMVIVDPVTVQDTEFLLPIGTVKFDSTAAQTGNIKWYMIYKPLSPSSVVTAAA